MVIKLTGLPHYLKLMRKNFKEKNLLVENFGFPDLSIRAFELSHGSPRIAVVNGLHGLERTGAYLMEKIVKNSKVNKGTLSLIPFANPTSALRNTRLTPEDSQDLNRLFPGNRDGTLSFKLAAVLFNYLKNFDVVIDVHTFPKMQMPIVGVFFSNISREQKGQLLKIMKVFSPDYIWKLDTTRDETGKAGSLIEALLKIGQIAFSVEVPDVELITPVQEKQFFKGVQNILDYLNETKTFRKLRKSPIITRIPVISETSGFFIPKVRPNQTVKKGQLVGEILELKKFKRLAVVSSQSGPVIFILQKTFVASGERVVIVGNIVE